MQEGGERVDARIESGNGRNAMKKKGKKKKVSVEKVLSIRPPTSFIY